jgi:hypothetical protein
MRWNISFVLEPWQLLLVPPALRGERQAAIHWQRPLRQAWLPCGKSGEPDSYMIHAPHVMVLHDGQWHLFYSGSNTAHNHCHSYGPPVQVVMYATCRQPWA